MARHIPWILLYSRLCFGPLIIALQLLHVPHYPVIAISLLFTGFLTDIFDGIAARHLGVSTEKLRRLDSSIDMVFYISFLVATYLQCPDFFYANKLSLTLLVGAEGLIYAVSYLKFRKEVATHSLAAKAWAILVFAVLVQVIWQCESGVLYLFCFGLGMASRAEILAILFVLKRWTNDVPTVVHAVRLRQGKEIRRHKLFNG